MTEQVKIQTDHLIDTMKESACYQHYMDLQQKLKADDFIWNRLNEYRRKRFFLQTRDSWNYDEGTLQDEYQEIVNQLDVKDFLETEMKLCKMVRQINNSIFDSLEMDIDFLEG